MGFSRANHPSQILATVLVAGSLAACGESESESESESEGESEGELVNLNALAGQFCRQGCQRQADCDDSPAAAGFVDACVDGCILGIQSGYARGDGCAAAADGLLSCEARLDCSAPERGACADELQAIAGVCTVAPAPPGADRTNPDPGADVIRGDVTDLTGRGEWGGIVLSGFGVNVRGDTSGELYSRALGLFPTDEPRWFGGNDNADDSGVLRYVIVAEAAVDFYEGAPPAITFEAVGRGTTVDHVQVLGAEGDGFDWLGGAVNASHLVINGVHADSLDLDDGYVGQIQFALVRMGERNGFRGVEIDGRGRTNPSASLAHVTVLGNAGHASRQTSAALHRTGGSGAVYRSVFTDDHLAGAAFADGCFDVDDSMSDELRYRDVLFDCTGGALHDDDDTEDGSVATNFQTEAVDTGQVEYREDPGLAVTPSLAVTTSAPAPSQPDRKSVV
jgi:hypothetical protein